jgi:predicted nucleic acid-binding protein
VSAVTRIARAGGLTRSERDVILAAHAALPVARHATHSLWRRIADLSERHSTYDAAYVVLAEALDAPLLTTDGRLARAVTTVEVIHPR